MNPLPRLHLAPMQDVSVLPLWRCLERRGGPDVHTGAIARAVTRLPFPVVANGSIVSATAAVAMAGKTGAAGLMLGRGAIRDPWIFASVRAAFGGGSLPRPSLRDLHGYLRELADEVASEGRFDREIDLVNRLKKFTNYIASGISGGAFARELRRATSLSGFAQSCQTHLGRDDPFPAEPGEDGTLFCGFPGLVEGRIA